MSEEVSEVIRSTREIMEEDDGFVCIRSGQFDIKTTLGRTLRARLIGEDVLGNRTVVVVLWTGEPQVMQLYDREITEIITLQADDTSRFDRVLGGVV